MGVRIIRKLFSILRCLGATSIFRCLDTIRFNLLRGPFVKQPLHVCFSRPRCKHTQQRISSVQIRFRACNLETLWNTLQSCHGFTCSFEAAFKVFHKWRTVRSFMLYPKDERDHYLYIANRHTLLSLLFQNQEGLVVRTPCVRTAILTSLCCFACPAHNRRRPVVLCRINQSASGPKASGGKQKQQRPLFPVIHSLTSSPVFASKPKFDEGPLYGVTTKTRGFSLSSVATTVTSSKSSCWQATLAKSLRKGNTELSFRPSANISRT